MAEKKEVYTKAAIAVAVLVVVWLILSYTRSGQTTPKIIVAEKADSPFAAPYLTTTPGIPDTRPNMNFQGGDNNINVSAGLGNGLSRQFMPLFGFVGMTAVKG